MTAILFHFCYIKFKPNWMMWRDRALDASLCLHFYILDVLNLYSLCKFDSNFRWNYFLFHLLHTLSCYYLTFSCLLVNFRTFLKAFTLEIWHIIFLLFLLLLTKLVFGLNSHLLIHPLSSIHQPILLTNSFINIVEVSSMKWCPLTSNDKVIPGFWPLLSSM